MTIVEVCAIIGCAANILGAVVPCIIVAIYNRQRYSAYCSSRRITFFKFNSSKAAILRSHFLFILYNIMEKMSSLFLLFYLLKLKKCYVAIVHYLQMSLLTSAYELL